jgi:hypothetical protein
MERCKVFQNVTNFRRSGYCEYDDLVGYSNFTIILIGVSVIGIVVLGVAIIFYNLFVINIKY